MDQTAFQAGVAGPLPNFGTILVLGYKYMVRKRLGGPRIFEWYRPVFSEKRWKHCSLQSIIRVPYVGRSHESSQWDLANERIRIKPVSSHTYNGLYHAGELIIECHVD